VCLEEGKAILARWLSWQATASETGLPAASGKTADLLAGDPTPRVIGQPARAPGKRQRKRRTPPCGQGRPPSFREALTSDEKLESAWLSGGSPRRASNLNVQTPLRRRSPSSRPEASWRRIRLR
jgi:hypothetical protein